MARENDIDAFGDTGDEFSDGQMVFIDFEFAPTKDIEGQFTVNILGNVAQKEPIEIAYGRRGLPIEVQTIESIPELSGENEIEFSREFNDQERIEIYDFNATYRSQYGDIEGFYHTPRYHWKYEGDFFGLIRETTDLDGQDIWNDKAPNGVEFRGKAAFDGLKLLGGPEVYWGANPQLVLKYSSQFGKMLPIAKDSLFGKTNYTVIFQEELDRRGQGSSGTAATQRETRRATLYTETNFTDDWKLELGGIISATDRVDEEYTRVENGNVILDEIDWGDTLGFRAKLSFPFFGALGYVATHQAGLVAEGGDTLTEWGTLIDRGGDLGNKREYEAGLRIPMGNWTLYPRYLWRENLVDANPSLPSDVDNGDLFPGAGPRNRDDDPFAVLGNREAKSAEMVLTFDPTPATWFYQWDNDDREDARLAFNVGAIYTEYPTFTDAYQFFFAPTETNPAFGTGLPPEDTWEVRSRIVMNPTPNVRLITNIRRAFLQSTGQAEGGTRKFWEWTAKAIIGGRHILDGYFRKDAFGPYDFQRQFNVVFPEQYRLDYSILLDQKKDQKFSTRLGLRGTFRTNDETRPDNLVLPSEVDNKWNYLVVAYIIFNFGGTNPPMPIDSRLIN